jgi:2-succinyl-6-hydroxy-2,4-cyclohexadiene-1-carboxylate synthase
MTEHEPHEPHYDIHDGTGPYLLMVHGFLSSRAQWQLNLAALSQVSRPVVVELWGHGRSPSPDDPTRYHPDAYVAFFDALRQRLGVEQWMVCGQSLGAALTLRYAFTHPNRVLAHVFTNSNAGLADTEWITARRKGAWEQADAIDREGRAAVERIPVHPRHARRLPADVHQALVADAALHTPQGIARTLRYTTSVSPVRDRVGENRVPTLLVCGERERRFAGKREFVEGAMPHLKVLGTPGGHAVNIETADAFNAAAVAFIRQHR